MGLPAGAKMTAADLRQRIDACLGLDKPAAQRTPEQQRKVQTIVDVVKIPASSIQSHLNWGTFHFQDIAQLRTGGRNVFGNTGVQYRGSPDDAALNAAVLRYAADPQAKAAFGADTDPDGRIPVPVLTVHGIDDPTAFVEMDDSFRRTMEQAGTGGPPGADLHHRQHAQLPERPGVPDAARRAGELDPRRREADSGAGRHAVRELRAGFRQGLPLPPPTTSRSRLPRACRRVPEAHAILNSSRSAWCENRTSAFVVLQFQVCWRCAAGRLKVRASNTTSHSAASRRADS
jgi:hypothetical protein